MSWRLFQGDALTILKSLPEKSVHCCVTSPPYFGLRDYGLPPIAWPEVEFSPMPGLPPVKVPAWEGCLDEETEILTYDGWKKYVEIKEGDLVATFNFQKQTLEYQPIKETFIDYYDGEMISIKNKHVDQLLTPNHRVLHKYRLHSGNRCWISDWQFTEARNVEYKHGLILPVAASYEGKNSVGEDLAELIGWILTDGTLSTSRGYRITIFQSKEKGIKRICYLLNRLGIKYSIHKRKEKTNYTKEGKEPKERAYIRFSGEWAKRIRDIIPVKKLNSFLLHLKQNELKRLFDGIYGGDGSGQSIYKNEEFRDALQILCLHLGLRTVWNEKKQSIEFANRKTIEVSRECAKRRQNKPSDWGITKKRYKGIVWCVKTDNSTFVARRNKKVFITGNSLGLEPTPEMYVAHLVLIFREVRRMLRDDGTFWLNLGDSYAGSGGAHAEHHNNPGISNSWKRNGVPHYGKLGMPQKYAPPAGLKAKDLIGIPWRVAFALQADGWWLRSDISWVKMNAMPSSTRDRPGVAHEYFFLFSKSRKYFYDAEAVRKERATHENRPDAVVRDRTLGYDSKLSKIRGRKQDALGKSTYTGFNDRWKNSPTVGRNRRTSDWLVESLDIVIEESQEYLRHLINVRDGGGMLQDEAGDPLALLVNTQPFKGAHFAAFNARLITPCILAGTSPKACPKCGAPWERVLEKTGHINKREPAHVPWNTPTKTDSTGWAPMTRATDNFKPTCSCSDNDGSGRCVVLDPFAGSGTTLLVAESLGRDSIGIELSSDYCKMIEKRLKEADIDGLGKNRKIERQIEGAVAKQLSLF